MILDSRRRSRAGPLMDVSGARGRSDERRVQLRGYSGATLEVDVTSSVDTHNTSGVAGALEQLHAAPCLAGDATGPDDMTPDLAALVARRAVSRRRRDSAYCTDPLLDRAESHTCPFGRCNGSCTSSP